MSPSTLDIFSRLLRMVSRTIQHQTPRKGAAFTVIMGRFNFSLRDTVFCAKSVTLVILFKWYTMWNHITLRIHFIAAYVPIVFNVRLAQFEKMVFLEFLEKARKV